MDQNKCKEQLISELEGLRRQVAELQEGQRQAALLRALPLEIHQCDLKGRITFVNQVQEGIAGYTAEELLGTYAWDRMELQEDKGRLPGYLKQLAAEQPPPTPFICRNVRKDGQSFDACVLWNYLRNAQGQVTGFVSAVTDITQWKQAEKAVQRLKDELERRVEERTEELAKANDELRVIYENMMDGLLIGDCESGRLLRANPAICRMLGYSQDQLLSMSVFDIHPPEAVPNVLKKFRTHEEGQKYVTQNRPMLRSDGAALYVDTSNARISYQGRPCVIGLVRDATQRKQAEESLRQSQATLNAFFSASTEILNLLDDELRYIKTDNLTPSYFGLDSASIAGRSMADVAPMLVERYGEMMQRVIATGAPVHNLEMKGSVPQRPGEAIYWRTSFFQVPLPEGKYGLGIVGAEITDTKRAEAALRQSHDELRAIYEGMVDGLLVIDIETKRFVRANAAICRLLGYSEDELLGLSVTDIHRSEDLPLVAGQFKAMAEGRLLFSENVPVMRKDGSVFHAIVSTGRVTFDDRRCVVGFFHDVTDRKRAEEALAKEHRTLKYLLQSSDHERQLIGYEIHDELAQQLAGAIMQFETFACQKAARPKEAEDAFHAGLTMLRKGHFETRRLIAGVRPPILDEAGVVEAIAHLVNELRRRKGPQIEFLNVVGFDRLVPALENSMYRIIQEALTNACQHSRSERVRVSLLQQGDRIRIEIRDWGIGFDARQKRENRFGLEGIRQRARLLGGKYSIRSAAGKGTRIVVELPVVPREADD